MTTMAERIRDYATDHCITPARANGDHEVTVIAGEVGAALGLEDRMPNVCQALGGRKLERMANVRTIILPNENAPSGQSPTMQYRYILL